MGAINKLGKPSKSEVPTKYAIDYHTIYSPARDTKLVDQYSQKLVK